MRRRLPQRPSDMRQRDNSLSRAVQEKRRTARQTSNRNRSADPENRGERRVDDELRVDVTHWREHDVFSARTRTQEFDERQTVRDLPDDAKRVRSVLRGPRMRSDATSATRKKRIVYFVSNATPAVAPATIHQDGSSSMTARVAKYATSVHSSGSNVVVLNVAVTPTITGAGPTARPARIWAIVLPPRSRTSAHVARTAPAARRFGRVRRARGALDGPRSSFVMPVRGVSRGRSPRMQPRGRRRRCLHYRREPTTIRTRARGPSFRARGSRTW